MKENIKNNFKNQTDPFAVANSVKTLINGEVFSVPEKILVKKTEKYGMGIFSTQFIDKGSIIYEAKCLLTEKNAIPNIDYDHFFAFDVLKQKYQAFGFDRYMNHSCEPNCAAIESRYQDDSIDYKVMALKDIAAGEQLFEDYFSFEYSEKKIPHCTCGATNCLKTINGFKNLSYLEKLRRVSRCEYQLIKKWSEDDPMVRIIDISMEKVKDMFNIDKVELYTIDEAILQKEAFRISSEKEPIKILKVGHKFLWCSPEQYAAIDNSCSITDQFSQPR